MLAAPDSSLRPRRPRLRGVGGVLAILAGVLLIVLERRSGGGAGTGCFWIGIAVLLIALGLAELASLMRRDGPGGPEAL